MLQAAKRRRRRYPLGVLSAKRGGRPRRVVPTRRVDLTMKVIEILAPVAMIGLSASNVAAAPFHHHHVSVTHPRRAHEPRDFAGSNPAGEDNPYANYHGPGSEVLNATVRAANEPGVTLELAPDAKETATGGPVGGPPGFDGS